METKDILLVVLVIAVAVGSRFLRKKKGVGSLFSAFTGKGGDSKSNGTNSDSSGDDYEPYSGK